jgi:hypothetical protein
MTLEEGEIVNQNMTPELWDDLDQDTERLAGGEKQFWSLLDVLRFTKEGGGYIGEPVDENTDENTGDDNMGDTNVVNNTPKYNVSLIEGDTIYEFNSPQRIPFAAQKDPHTGETVYTSSLGQMVIESEDGSKRRCITPENTVITWTALPTSERDGEGCFQLVIEKPDVNQPKIIAQHYPNAYVPNVNIKVFCVDGSTAEVATMVMVRQSLLNCILWTGARLRWRRW